MAFHRVFSTLATLTACLLLTSTAFGQAKPAEQPEKLKLNKTEMTHYKAITSLVDSVLASKEPAPADVKLKFQNHFIRSATNVFVPYVLEMSGGKFTSFPVALYVRAVRKGVTTAAAEPDFTDIYFFPNANSFINAGGDVLQVTRALELPAGDFDIHFAMSEPPPRNEKTPIKRVVHTQPLTVPDLASALTTSSIILAKNLEEAPQQLTPRQQMEQPFTIGGQKITPTFTPTFAKSAELLFIFLVYGEGATPEGKPDVEVAYTLSRGEEAKPFAKMPNTAFNSTTLPPEFSLSAGHQVLVAQGVPLSTFAPGEYKLNLTITDKTNSQSITRTVPFTVTP